VKNLDIIIPLYNEEDNLLELINSLSSVKDQLKDKLNISLLFVNDGSTDDSLELLKKISWEKKYVKVVSLSKNFGYQIAIAAGIDNSNADYACIIDSDLQDPPSLILDMYNKSLEGFDIVYGKFSQNENDSAFIKSIKNVFNWVIKKTLSTDIYLRDDFIFLSKTVLDTLKSMPEKHRFLREMIDWSGYKSTVLSFDREELYSKSIYTPWRQYLFFVRSILSSSIRPLKLTYILAGLLFLISVISFIKLNMISSTVLFVGAVQIFALGIVSSYIGRLFEQVKGRPLYIVKDKFNF